MPKRPTLLILANAFVSTKSIGGGDRFIIDVSPALAKATNATIITPKVGFLNWRKLGLAKTTYHILKPNFFDNRDNPTLIGLAYISRTLQTLELTWEKRFDTLLTASQFFPDILPAAFLKRVNPSLRWVARLYHLIAPPTRRPGNPLVNAAAYLLQKAMLNLLRNANLIVVDNPLTRTTLLSLGFPEDRLASLPCGIPLSAIVQQQKDQKQRFTALHLGRLDPHKGIFDLPQIWAKVTEAIPNATLAVTGYGPKAVTEKLKREFRTRNLSKNITFLGFLPYKKGNQYPLYALLKSAKLLLFTDHEAGFGIVVAEAMAAGLPIVTYTLPSFGTTYRKGFLTAPLKDTHAFSKQVIKLLKNETQRKKLARQAKTQGLDFDISTIASRFTNLVLG